jgi:lauroyl-KDO2-lipid IV(A) myristoyltransferase
MSKPFISIKNPFGDNYLKGERFSFGYFAPKYWLTWIFLLSSYPIAYLPGSLRDSVGCLIGEIMRRYGKTNREIITKNLKETFKDISQIEIQDICKMYFKNLGCMYVNLPQLWWKSDYSLQHIIDKEGTHLVDDILENNQSVILLAPHSLSLEFGGRAISRYDVLSMYKPFKNNLINWFIGRSRCCKENDKAIIYPRNMQGMKSIIRKMNHPSVLYFLADEDISVDNSIFSKFFDTKKASLKSVSKLAKITKSKVLPCICTYDINTHRFLFKVFPEIKDFPSDDIRDDCAKVNAVLEKQIQIDKTQYMWTLRIFKHRPDGSDIYKI